jgi:hypothetical protein
VKNGIELTKLQPFEVEGSKTQKTTEHYKACFGTPKNLLVYWFVAIRVPR